MSREILHVITNHEKLSMPVKGIIVEAHFDDKAMAMIEASLSQRVGLTVAGLTDGAARDLPEFSPQALRLIRRKEHIESVRVLGGAQALGADLPDGLLAECIDEGITFLDTIVRSEKPDFLIAPHPQDPHPDHRAAAEITKIVGNGEIAIYYMDTITGRDKDGERISPTHYFPLIQRDVRRRKKSYLANTSQVRNLPTGEINAVFDVLAMPKRRGSDIGVRFAGAVTFEPPNDRSDPLREIFSETVRVVHQRKI